MASDLPIAREVARRQVTMFAMFVGPGLHVTRHALSAATGIPTSTLKDWASGSAMPFWGAMCLARILPAAAVNMMAEPAGKRVSDAEGSVATWDEVAADGAGLLAEICEARRDGAIDHVENARLKKLTRDLIAQCQGAIGDDE